MDHFTHLLQGISDDENTRLLVCGIIDKGEDGRNWTREIDRVTCKGCLGEDAELDDDSPRTSSSYREFVNVNGVTIAGRLAQVIAERVHSTTPADERVAWLNTVQKLHECLTISERDSEMLKDILFKAAEVNKR